MGMCKKIKPNSYCDENLQSCGILVRHSKYVDEAVMIGSLDKTVKRPE